MKDIIRIRPHHLLCIINFYGKGYSASFIQTLKEIKEKIEQDSVLIRLVHGQDDICKNCPSKPSCLQFDYPNTLDEKVLLVTNMEYGKVYSSKEVLSNIKKNISKEMLEMICKDCAFYEICKNVFNKRIDASS
ncbi:MAG: DUF1284 domain-containing protein [Candidatus Methanofastidiosia archaeon]